MDTTETAVAPNLVFIVGVGLVYADCKHSPVECDCAE